ncbi:hypothetical protein DPMN_153387 [Dreissena polymorpha]|uniref:Uncharacterized protein n=1 Tax=Dreissena polymorpha TaxID=45954 RepID=A0A9D4FPV3_DREPO|nr:hypothetical protein DPMN_153387 [Dreissena polymorpha]
MQLKLFSTYSSTVVTALDQLSAEHGDTKAGVYKMAVLTFDFIVTLVAVEHVLQDWCRFQTFFRRKSAILLRL